MSVRALLSRRRKPRYAGRPPGTDWTCHVCGRWRPDAAISVHSRIAYFHSVEFQENVRYCNDDPDCIAGAPHVHHIKGAST